MTIKDMLQKINIHIFEAYKYIFENWFFENGKFNS